MASPNSSAPTTVPRDIEEKLDNFQSQVLLMILSYVNGIFQDTAPSLMEHLLKLERDNNSFSGIINYTFKRLKVNPALFFTPDRGTVQLPQVKAEGIELRLALVNFIISFNDQQAASRAIKNIAKEGSSLLAQQRTPLEIIEEVCKRRSFKDVVSISTSVAQEFNGARFFKHLHNTDWLHNRDDVNQFLREESGFSSLSGEMALFMTQKLSISDYTLISISKKLCGVCQKHPKGAIFCISVPIALLAFLLVGVGISIGISYLSPISTIQSMEIGDKQSSSALIPVPNNVYSVSLNIPSGVTEFMALSIPPTGTQIINRTKIFQSDGHCAPYNVNNGDNPVYLLPGSIMNYTLTVSDSNSSQCPAQLVLLNNRAEYLKCNYNSSSVVKVYCLASGTVNHVSIRINKSANYYVVLLGTPLKLLFIIILFTTLLMNNAYC
ncbi:PREDICTED: uncharacterized protein LOC109586997 [Amphimedon queenslandica]|uniref:Uncharacterized protein n=1 Tax=Amphimedon queenslandica TaxID=400682 RepID=A0AAN0JP14_AMPQE|nr:PREDICTED: uncharacterized protein LOC109586997 [Amphimedon queenslandica]|eukprot:XP_019858780.1 PREDICTED: uncharacterized protein LOC109586997 [Amphimedon queenslandica]